MPGGSKKGGGLKVKSAYKMKNSALLMGAKHGAPIQANYGSPMKDYSVEKGSHDHPHSPMKTHTTGVPHKTDKERLKEIEEMKKFWSEKDKRAEATKTRDDKIKKEKEQEKESERFFKDLKKPF